MGGQSRLIVTSVFPRVAIVAGSVTKSQSSPGNGTFFQPNPARIVPSGNGRFCPAPARTANANMRNCFNATPLPANRLCRDCAETAGNCSETRWASVRVCDRNDIIAGDLRAAGPDRRSTFDDVNDGFADGCCRHEGA